MELASLLLVCLQFYLIIAPEITGHLVIGSNSKENNTTRANDPRTIDVGIYDLEGGVSLPLNVSQHSDNE